MREKFHIPLHTRILRVFLKPLFRFLFGTLGRVRVIGKENIPLGQAYIVAINHISIFDPPLAVAFWPEMAEVIAAADVWDKPGQNLVVGLYGSLPVHRGEYDRAILERVRSALGAGRPLVIAPEGGRSHVTSMRQAMPGIGFIVEQADVPVIPVGLVGTTEDFWQRARRGQRPRLEIRIGKPFRLPKITGSGAERRAGRQRNADLVLQHVAGLLPPEYRGFYADTAILPTETDH